MAKNVFNYNSVDINFKKYLQVDKFLNDTLYNDITSNLPDLSSIKKSISMVAKFLKKNDVVILESTVYPGVTQICSNYFDVPKHNPNVLKKFEDLFYLLIFQTIHYSS